MTRDDIARMAQEAGFGNYAHEARTMFERFFHMAQAAEREACAKVCDEVHREYDGEEVSASWIATAIRARTTNQGE